MKKKPFSKHVSYFGRSDAYPYDSFIFDVIPLRQNVTDRPTCLDRLACPDCHWLAQLSYARRMPRLPWLPNLPVRRVISQLRVATRTQFRMVHARH